jgi:UrcA family protein
MNTFTALAGTAILGLLVTNAAHSADWTEPKSVTVEFADLDLSRADGTARLFNRIKLAARKVCGGSYVDRLQEKKKQRAACIEFALSDAVARVDRPELTQYVASQSSIKRKASVSVASGR